MSSRSKLSIIIPVFNESKRLPRLLNGLHGAGSEIASSGLVLHEVVIVDDGSTDSTADELRHATTQSLKLNPVLRGLPNEGKGAAVAAGIREASGDLVLIADADIATPFSEVRKLYERLEQGADLAIGSRDAVGAHVTGAPRSRVIIGRLFNRFVRTVTGLPFRDTQCGFKMMETAEARRLIEKQRVQGFAFDVELLMRAMSEGLTVAEVGVRYRHGAGSTVSPVRHAPRMTLDIAKLAFAMRSRSRSNSAEVRVRA